MWDSQGRAVARHQPSGDFQCGEALRLCEFLGIAQWLRTRYNEILQFAGPGKTATLASLPSEHVPVGPGMPRCGSTATEGF